MIHNNIRTIYGSFLLTEGFEMSVFDRMYLEWMRSTTIIYEIDSNWTL